MRAAVPLHRLIGKREPFESLTQEAFLNLWRASELLEQLHDALFAGHGLTAPQYNVLRILRGEHPEPLSMQAVARRLVTRAPDLTRLIDRVVAAGWAKREASARDRRSMLVSVTPAGMELMERLEGPLIGMHDRQLGHLSGEELKALIELLEKARAPHERAGETALAEPA